MAVIDTSGPTTAYRTCQLQANPHCAATISPLCGADNAMSTLYLHTHTDIGSYPVWWVH